MRGKLFSLAADVSFSNVVSFVERHVHRLLLGSSVLSGALIAGFIIHWVAFHLVLQKYVSIEHRGVLLRFRKPAFWLLVLFAAMGAVPTFDLSNSGEDITEHILHILFIITLAWIFIACVYAVQDILMRRYDVRTADNLRARGMRTQMAVIRRLVIGFIGLVAVALILYTFHHTRLWQAGAGLLASAGLASLALAAAAKSTVSNLLAGIQIALTEPIRLDDVVIIEGQWGRIEEITSAYVVVCIWNLERLIVPLSYFIENPFQNWTRRSADLLGTFYIYADYTCPIEPLREEFVRVLKSTNLWDGKAQVLQVTDLFQDVMQIRALMSAADSGKLFDLRCYAREKMIDFLQKNYSTSLPKRRIAELQSPPWSQIDQHFGEINKHSV